MARLGYKDGRSALLSVIEKRDNEERLRLPEESFPRLFVTFPIAGSGILPFNVVLDGQFTPEQERDGILLDHHDKSLIEAALSCLPTFVRHAVESHWTGAHNLAQLSAPTTVFTGEDDSGESEWWKTVILKTAKAIASEAIIETEAGLLPALSRGGGDAVCFLVPSISADGDTLFAYERIHDLAATLDGLHIPKQDIAQEWREIADHWTDVGVAVQRLGFQELTDWVKAGRECMEDLPVLEDRFQWITRLFVLAADLADTHTVSHMLDKLLPNQHSEFCSSVQLSPDRDVSTGIKEIGSDAGVDFRARLLHEELSRALGEPSFKGARDLIWKLVGDEYSESRAVAELLEKLEQDLPDDSDMAESELSALLVSCRLIAHLRDREDTPNLRRCPLLTSNNTITYLTGSQQILAPAGRWPESCRPYVDLYTANRILSDRYCQGGELAVAVDALVSVGLAIPAPLYNGKRTEVDANLLRAMAPSEQSTDGVSVRNEAFGQIAFLSQELINRTGNEPAVAKRLLEFVLNVAAREDESWRESGQVSGSRSGEQVQLTLRGATWPFELKVRSWVPLRLSEESEKEVYAPGPANEGNVQALYEPSWLRDNPEAVALLHDVFGLRELTLMINSLDPEREPDVVELLRDPALVQSVVANPAATMLIAQAGSEELQEIAEELEERSRRAEARERNRSFGYAAQEAVAKALRERGLKLELVDAGYDYEVFPGSLDADLDEAQCSFKVGSYFLEVKATATGDVRLTPLQAQTGSDRPERFVLGVVDLRGQTIQRRWESSDIERLARIAMGVGEHVRDVYRNVDTLADSANQVRLRNEQQLRYSVAPSLWEGGLSIGEWVENLKERGVIER